MSGVNLAEHEVSGGTDEHSEQKSSMSCINLAGYEVSGGTDEHSEQKSSMSGINMAEHEVSGGTDVHSEQKSSIKGMLVIISGPSGSGKGSVVKQLDYSLSISVTTRKMRETEQHGTDYFFCSEDEFVRMRENNELLEHAAYVGQFYGTPRKYVDEQIDKGKVVVLEIEVNGALQVKEKFPDAVLIFLIPPTMNELARRLVFRSTEDVLAIEDRMARALEEVQLIDRYDYLVINDNLNDAVQEIDTIVKAEYLKPHRSASRIEKFTYK